MEDLGCVFGCVEEFVLFFFCHKHWLDMCVQYFFFSLFSEEST